MKKGIAIILVMLMCTSLLFTACSNEADAMKMLEKSSKYYNKQNNVKIDSFIESCVIYNSMYSGEPIICGTTTSVSTALYNNPFSFKSNVLSSYDDKIEDGGISFLMQNNSEIIQYALEENDKISIYQEQDGEWLRVDLAKEDFLLNDIIGLNYIKNFDKYVSEGKILGNEKIEDKDATKAEYTFNQEYLNIMYKKYGFIEFAKKINSEDVEGVINELMKDVKLTIWFDQKSDEIIQMEINMTSLMDAFRKVVIENNKAHLSEESYTYLNECADKIKIKNTIKLTNINGNEDFELPEGAKEAKAFE